MGEVHTPLGVDDKEGTEYESAASYRSSDLDKREDTKDTLNTSLQATNEHVFLTWHDINFIVPKSKARKKKAIETDGLISFDDDRVTLL